VVLFFQNTLSIFEIIYKRGFNVNEEINIGMNGMNGMNGVRWCECGVLAFVNLCIVEAISRLYVCCVVNV
jgi:hypothetical protein